MSNLTVTEPVIDEVVLAAGVPMERLSLEDFVSEHGFKTYVHQLRTNTKGYPFVTFITPDNRSKNIYLSKAAGDIMLDDLAIEPYKDKLELDMLVENFKLMWSETPALNVLDNRGKVKEKGYTWKLVSGNEGESLRTEFKF